MTIIEKRKINMFNYALNERNHKWMDEPTKNDFLVGYLAEFDDIEDVNDLIQIGNNALSNIFTGTNDGWISTFGFYVKITSSTITFYEEDETTVLQTHGIQDFLELLHEWKKFLETPPYHMQKL